MTNELFNTESTVVCCRRLLFTVWLLFSGIYIILDIPIGQICNNYILYMFQIMLHRLFSIHNLYLCKLTNINSKHLILSLPIYISRCGANTFLSLNTVITLQMIIYCSWAVLCDNRVLCINFKHQLGL